MAEPVRHLIGASVNSSKDGFNGFSGDDCDQQLDFHHFLLDVARNSQLFFNYIFTFKYICDFSGQESASTWINSSFRSDQLAFMGTSSDFLFLPHLLVEIEYVPDFGLPSANCAADFWVFGQTAQQSVT
uniref:Uncharacterized protein n=1 Tax=Ditylenchus dipsaci TaxID=166011 RepID=A0A915DCT6_9BILA